MPAPYSVKTRSAIFDEGSGLWKIPLTKGEFAIVDSWDAEFLSQFNWSLKIGDSGVRYAKRHVRTPFGTITVRMHRVVAERADILGTTKLEVDHKNSNGLDNRCANLRIATRAQNGSNTRIRTDNTSGVKGVSWDAKRGRWVAEINHNGKRHRLGYFQALEDAAVAYAEANARFHKEFGRLS